MVSRLCFRQANGRSFIRTPPKLTGSITSIMSINVLYTQVWTIEALRCFSHLLIPRQEQFILTQCFDHAQGRSAPKKSLDPASPRVGFDSCHHPERLPQRKRAHLSPHPSTCSAIQQVLLPSSCSSNSSSRCSQVHTALPTTSQNFLLGSQHPASLYASLRTYTSRLSRVIWPQSTFPAGKTPDLGKAGDDHRAEETRHSESRKPGQ